MNTWGKLFDRETISRAQLRMRPWRVRLATWLLTREAERSFKRDGRDVSIIVSRSITATVVND